MIVKVKPGCSHRVGPDRLAVAGDEIEITEAEFASFGDKFIRLVEAEAVEISETEATTKSRKTPRKKSG